MEMATAIIFMGCCIFLPMLLGTFSNVNQKTLVKKEIVEVVKYLPQPTPVIQENPIKNDAIECLVSLGLKKSEAKKKVNEMFAKFEYQTIESFLLDVYKV